MYNGLPCERFLAFHHCTSGVSGEAIAEDILSKITEWQLQPQLLRGQAYDVAGAMAGKSKGAASRILQKYPKAFFTHCAAHRLNLCVIKCCLILDARNQQYDGHSRQDISVFQQFTKETACLGGVDGECAS